jgi:hypothetical protein
MSGRAVDNLTLERWRALDAPDVLEKLGWDSKGDGTCEPVFAHDTNRFHVSMDGRVLGLLFRGLKFFAPRAGRGGAEDLAKHLHDLDFKISTALLRRLSV